MAALVGLFRISPIDGQGAVNPDPDTVTDRLRLEDEPGVARRAARPERKPSPIREEQGAGRETILGIALDMGLITLWETRRLGRANEKTRVAAVVDLDLRPDAKVFVIAAWTIEIGRPALA